MKNIRQSQGSVLVSASCTAGVLAILIAGFLAYMSNEYDLNYRAHRWNQAFHLAESAVEVGLAQYNYQYTLGGSGFTSGNGWSGSSGTYSMTTNLTDTSGNTVGSFQITASGIGGSNPQFTGVGTVTSANFGGQSIARAVLVTVAGASSSLFPYALVSESPLTFGGGVYVDSYDSSNPNYSTNGQYDSSKREANGNIATTSSSATAVTLKGSGDVYGTVAIGPGGSATITGGAAMGPTFSGQATTVASATSDGWLTSAFTSPPQNVTLPTSLSSASNIGTISLSSSGTQTVGTGGTTAYQVNALSVVGNSCLTITGNVSLYVIGSVAVQNSGSINITPGSSLTVYIGGPTADIEGAGIVNNGLRSENNEWYGLSTLNNGTIAGSGVFNGTLYAPDAKITISGSGSISGALVASNLVMSGSGAIHYDQSLKNTSGGSSTSYSIVSWQELRYLGGSWVP